MSALAALEKTALSALHDPRLFREYAYADGRWIAAPDGAEIDVTNPADGTRVGAVPALSAAQVDETISAAHRAFREWSMLLPQERSQILLRWHGLIVNAREDLARLMVIEQGKPLSEACGEIDYAASFVEFYAEEAKRLNIESVTSHLPDAQMRISREPAGVAGLVTPWNFPSAMLTRKAAAALAAGCTVVAHPSSETPFSALALAELAERAGFPSGVLNVLTGKAAEVVGAMTASLHVRVLSFTGSTEIGRLLYGQCAPTVKKLVMELGGHAPFIAFADCDFERAVESAVSAKFATSGQDCLAANRFYIEQPIYDAFVEAFAEKVRALSIGPGLEDPDIGPLINARAVAKQEEHVADALKRGARLLTGGKRANIGPNFFLPTVLADVPPDALIFREETFGPIAAFTPFDSEDDVLQQANDTETGLVAYLHTQSPARIARFTRLLEFGMVAVNRTKITGAPIPFGGTKQAGLGREGSRMGMEEFTNVKYVCADTR